jgi:type II secretory pathway component GspD/PulD (secretin)
MNLPGQLNAQERRTVSVQRVIICLIPLEHADARHLASTLAPFLSPEGSIAPYTPTNTLIIKDRAYNVDRLARIITGKPCTAVGQPPAAESDTGLD